MWSVLASVDVGVWDWDVDENRVYWSDDVEGLFGLARGAFGRTYEAYLALISPDNRALVIRYIDEILAGTRDGYELEHRIEWPDGSVHWVGCKAHAYRDDTGKLIRVAGTVIDITRRKQAEAAMRDTDQLYRSAMDLSPLGIVVVDVSGRVFDANPAWCRLIGYTREEVLSPDFRPHQVTFDDDRAGNVQRMSELLAGPQTSHQFETRYRHRQGHVVWVQVNMTLVRNSDGTARHFFAQVEDITDRRAAQEALRSSEQMLRQLTDNLREAVWLCDLDDMKLLYASSRMAPVLGIEPCSFDEMMARWLQCVHVDDRAKVAAAHSDPTVEQEVTYRLIKPDGALGWIHCRVLPIRDATGRVHRSVGMAEDVTERRRVDEQLHHAQKMEAFGQLAGGVAHDFNNLLAVILPHAELASRAKGLDPHVAESISAITVAAERAATLTRQLLQLGRREVLDPVDVDLDETVAGLAGMLRRVLREDVHLELSRATSLPPVSADANMLGQVLMNLALNACDAMPDGGTLTIRTQSVTLTDAEAAAIDSARAGVYACIEVADTGHGIEPVNFKRLFEPFFTTKPPGKGTGLGLASVRGIIHQHGGCISVSTQVGVGTTFRVMLPALTARRERVPEPPRLTRHGDQQRILVVEDEPAVRATTVSVLEQHGYRVHSAVDATHALTVLEQHASALSLVITDLVMPGALSGRSLVSMIRDRWPHLRVVMLSGYSSDVFGHELQLRAGDQFVQKPVAIDRLLEIVGASLDHR